MKLSDGIKKAYDTQWSMVNTFTVQIDVPLFFVDEDIDFFGDELNLNVISVQTPDFTNDPIEVYIANKWVIQNGKDALYRFSITFRDQDQMSLYKKFMKMYELTKDSYFDEVAMTIHIRKDADWSNEEEKPLMKFEGVLIEAVSNLALSNDTENQIAEFTVNFKSNSPYVLD
jgi:hypothetical protein